MYCFYSSYIRPKLEKHLQKLRIHISLFIVFLYSKCTFQREICMQYVYINLIQRNEVMKQEIKLRTIKKTERGPLNKLKVL